MNREWRGENRKSERGFVMLNVISSRQCVLWKVIYGACPEPASTLSPLAWRMNGLLSTQPEHPSSFPLSLSLSLCHCLSHFLSLSHSLVFSSSFLLLEVGDQPRFLRLSLTCTNPQSSEKSTNLKQIDPYHVMTDVTVEILIGILNALVISVIPSIIRAPVVWQEC